MANPAMSIGIFLEGRELGSYSGTSDKETLYLKILAKEQVLYFPNDDFPILSTCFKPPRQSGLTKRVYKWISVFTRKWVKCDV